MKTILSIYLVFASLTISAQNEPDGFDISYGAHEKEKLDYWIATESNSPIVILIHGGAWRGGDKISPKWQNAANILRNLGYATLTVNHILSGDSTYTGFPHQSANIACAVAWTKINHELLNGDSSRIVLLGSSSGAHLAVMHGLIQSESLLDDCDHDAGLNVSGVIGLQGAYDFSVIENLDSRQAARDMVLNREEDWEAAQPVNQAHNQTNTKFLLMHGTEDGIVGSQQPFPFREALDNNGYCFELTILQGRGHNLMELWDDPLDPVRVRVTNYLDSLFSGNKCQPISTSTRKNNEYGVKIFPNPSADFIQIESPESFDKQNFSIVDITGRVYMEKELENSTREKIYLDPHLSPGIYTVLIEGKSQRSVHRLVVQ